MPATRPVRSPSFAAFGCSPGFVSRRGLELTVTVALALATLIVQPAFADDLVLDFGATQTIATSGNFAEVLYAGVESTGTLNLQGSGALQVYQGLLGYYDGSHGTLNVTGANARFVATANTYVGYEGNGTLVISNGGHAQTVVGLIGAYASGAAGMVTVTGTNSQWTTSLIHAGFFGHGSLTIADSAVVTTYQGVTLGTFGGATGSLGLNGTAGARGVLETLSLQQGSGTGALTFNGGILRAADDASFNPGTTTIAGGGAFIDTNGHTALFDGALAGAGALTKLGAGSLELTGANTYAGGTTLTAGTTRINNTSGSAFGPGAVTVASGATLTGAGSFTGAFQNNGIYAPGNSPTLALLSSFSQGDGGTLVLELGGLGRGTEYDALDILGAAALAGTLDVTFYNGFTAAAGNRFDLFNWGSATGTFATINLPTLGAGLSWDASQLYTSGELSVTASPIPEPSTYAVLTGLGALGLVIIRRRARQL